MAFCSGCGFELDETANFCPRCGRSKVSGGGPRTAAGLPTISENVAGALAYFLLPAIFFLLFAPYNGNRFVRFHCFQSIGFAVVSLIPRFMLYVPVAGLVLLPAVETVLFVIWVILFVKAWRGQKFSLPLIGEWAEDQAVKTA